MAGRLPTGVTVRHRKACSLRNHGTRCSCEPGYFARIRIDGRRVSEMCETLDEAEAFILTERGSSTQKPIGMLKWTVRNMGDQLISDMRSTPPRALSRNGDPYKPNLLRDYERDLHTSIYPLIGDIPVATLKPRDIEQLVGRLASQGRRDPRETYQHSTEPLAASTIRNRLKPLQVICRRARLAGILDSDPFAPVSLPSSGGYRDRVIPKEDVIRMYTTVDHPIVRCAWAIFLLSGMRLGEAKALTWADINEHSIDVHATWTSTRDTKGRVAAKTKPRKTPLSRMLRQELDTLKAFRAQTGVVEEADWVVLHGANPVVPISSQTIQRHAEAAWVSADPPLDIYTPHDARHTYVSLSVASEPSKSTITTPPVGSALPVVPVVAAPTKHDGGDKHKSNSRDSQRD